MLTEISIVLNIVLEVDSMDTVTNPEHNPCIYIDVGGLASLDTDTDIGNMFTDISTVLNIVLKVDSMDAVTDMHNI